MINDAQTHRAVRGRMTVRYKYGMACGAGQINIAFRAALRGAVPVYKTTAVGMPHLATSIPCVEHVLDDMLRAEAIRIWVSDEWHLNQISETDYKIDDFCALLPQSIERVRSLPQP